MNTSTTYEAAATQTPQRKVSVRDLIGAGHRIGKFVLPFLAVGVIANVLWPGFFSAGGPSELPRAISLGMLAVGVPIWLWSVVLIVTKVPRHELITSGPFALMKHPLYTAVSPLVLPAVGFLLNTWLGLALGLLVYAGSRLYVPEEELFLAAEFGSEWDEYAASVKLPWV